MNRYLRPACTWSARPASSWSRRDRRRESRGACRPSRPPRARRARAGSPAAPCTRRASADRRGRWEHEPQRGDHFPWWRATRIRDLSSNGVRHVLVAGARGRSCPPPHRRADEGEHLPVFLLRPDAGEVERAGRGATARTRRRGAPRNVVPGPNRSRYCATRSLTRRSRTDQVAPTRGTSSRVGPSRPHARPRRRSSHLPHRRERAGRLEPHAGDEVLVPEAREELHPATRDLDDAEVDVFVVAHRALRDAGREVLVPAAPACRVAPLATVRPFVRPTGARPAQRDELPPAVAADRGDAEPREAADARRRRAASRPRRRRWTRRRAARCARARRRAARYARPARRRLRRARPRSARAR